MQRPQVISIAGFDPCGGAGILADIKTLEQHKVYGLSINTAQTLQTESEFFNIRWEEESYILKALQLLLQHYNIVAVKIGIVQNAAVLSSIVNLIYKVNSNIKIVWDPVIKSSSGFAFWANGIDANLYEQTLTKIFLITPNYNEALKLVADAESSKEAAHHLCNYTNVLLKGGHNKSEPGIDYLYTRRSVMRFEPKVDVVYQKHGSGCVLSAAITAYLAKGYDLREACIMGKRYIEQFLNSNETLLGYHHV